MDLRSSVIELYGLSPSQTNMELTFFHDESNNIRKFLIKESGGYNNPINQVFVLGGLMTTTPNVKELPGINDLVKSLSLQKTMKEIKCEHIVGKGDFLHALNSQKLFTILSWIKDRELWLHFRCEDYLYYGLVDIIDEYYCAIQMSTEESRIAKAALYRVFREKEFEGSTFLRRFSYPNVGQDHESEFYKGLKDLCSKSSISEQEKQLLMRVINEAIKNPSCTFLYDNEPNVIQRWFAESYLDPLQIFCNSCHFFDEENTIEPILNSYVSASFLPGETLGHYEFLNSKDSYSIQISDVLVGVLSKLFKYIDSLSSYAKLRNDWGAMNTLQKSNFKMLAELIYRSLKLFPALINRTQPISSCAALDNVLFNVIFNT